MDILFVGGEIAPMVRRSDAADVIASLSKALRALGHRVTIALPRYPAIEQAGVLVARRLSPLVLRGPDGPVTEVVLYDGRLGSGADLLLVDVGKPGGSDGIDRPEGGDAVAWATFARSVAAVVADRARGDTPFDVVHGHDWVGGAALYLVDQAARREEITQAPRLVLTVHDVAAQGSFGREAIAALGLDASHFTPERLEFWGAVSFLKAGLLAADLVTTPSDTYARELATPERGERMDGLVRAHAARAGGPGVVGVTCGVDYAVDNPATDPSLAARYDADEPSAKGRCKSALAQELGLEIDPDRPTVGVVVRVGHRASSGGGSAEALLAAMPKLLRQDATLVVAATAIDDERLAERLEASLAGEPERAAWIARPTDAQLRRVLAGSDLLLVASGHDACSPWPMRAQRYGAVPIAVRAGGAIDTVVDLDAELGTGTGFLFDALTADDVGGAVARGISAMRSPRWGAVRRRVMRVDHGWERPARRYGALYKALVESRAPERVADVARA
jgi:starch synthase